MNSLWRRIAMLVLALMAMAVGLVGCGRGSSDNSGALESSAGSAASPMAPQGMRSDLKMESPADQPSPQAPERAEVVTGSASVTTDDPIGAARKTADQVKKLDGRLDNQSQQPGSDDVKPTASLTARVPAAKTDALIDSLNKVGTVADVSINRSDVTMQVTDLNARIAALQTSVDRLRQLMAQTGSVGDLIQAETALSQRQGELDSLSAQLRQVNEQVALSTITVNFSTDPAERSGHPNTFWEGVVAGWNSLVKALKATIVGLGTALPWLAFFAIIAMACIAGVQAILRARRSSRSTDSSPSAAVSPSTDVSTTPSPEVDDPARSD